MTAGVAAPAYAGIPVTHRDAASAVAFVTGHEDPAKHETALDWEALARFPGTLVFYMGVKNLPQIAERLMAAGRAPDEPAAVVERGTLPGQRTVTAPLGEHRRAGGGGRASARRRSRVVGPVAGAARHARLARAAAAARPGGGGHARARAGERAGRAAGGARRRGGRGAGDPDRAARRSGAAGRDRATSTSSASPAPTACGCSSTRLRAGDARALAGAQVAAIGPGTAAELRAHGIRADVVPERSVAEALVEALEPVRWTASACSWLAPPRRATCCPTACASAAPRCDVLALYDTVAEPLADGSARRSSRATT